MHNLSYKSKQEIMQITATAFNMADQDHNNAITIYEFPNFLTLVFKQLNIQRQANAQEC